MSNLEQKVRELAGAARAGGEAAVLGDLLEQLAREVRSGGVTIDALSRFALAPSAAWMELWLTIPGGLYVRLEVGRGRS